ncbi:rifin PIR protein, putative [Plasmodium reichenowi]|uniref:Rifin PIR protein, putative n=1 Tax=Plasmodium reichenowi TaxID=5854 RepID=A0A2P9DSQ2_PLARE|nr:rifin PIR protein, putative [Plasmodium reichenowi]
MKVHYINILLFALPLNILVTLYNVHKQRNQNSTTHHTQKIPNTRLLCECDLYMPNYDHDTEMKKVMDNFNKQTRQRFEEYDERMQSKRKRCKEQCDKETQKIILKDKLEKQMEQQLTTLETKIGTDDIPTCVCEKSMADKVEKNCLRCAGVFGGGVMPGMGLIDGSLLGAISVLKPLALEAAEKAALAEATKAATNAGIKAVKLKIEEINTACSTDKGFVNLISIVKESTYNNGDALVEAAEVLIGEARKIPGNTSTTPFYNTVINMKSGKFYIGNFGEIGSDAYNETLPLQKALLEKAKVNAVNTAYASYQTAITASIIAIVVIVLIMVTIYLILRYRRKKKMKKKLQYIKLLEE